MRIPVEGSEEVIEISDALVAREYNPALVHQVLTAYQHNGRQGNKAQKSRSEVRGGGAKPWRQKGTGRARSGSSRSPIWRGGGVTFAAKPRDLHQKVNKKMYRSALRVIISQLLRQNRFRIIADFVVEERKTRSAIQSLSQWNIKSGLLVVDLINPDIDYALRNLSSVKLTAGTHVNPWQLVHYPQVVMTRVGFDHFVNRLS